MDDTVFRVVLSIPRSDGDWLIKVLYGMLVNGADPFAWETDGSTTPAQAAAIFDGITKSWTPMFPMIGWIFDFPGDTPPDNTLVCDGAEYLIADYPDLYAVLDPVFHVDSTHFAVPDLRGRYKRGSTDGTDIGDELGADSVTLTAPQLPSHQHSIDGYVPGIAVSPGELPVLTDVAVPSGTGFTGAGDPVDITPASLVLLPCIIARYP